MSTLAYVAGLVLAFALGAWIANPLFDDVVRQLDRREKDLAERERKFSELCVRLYDALTKRLHGTG